jgi:hypothetical protein
MTNARVERDGVLLAVVHLVGVFPGPPNTRSLKRFLLGRPPTPSGVDPLTPTG